MYILKTAAIWGMAAPLFCSNLLAQEPQIAISSQVNRNHPHIVVRSKYDFEQKISLKVKTDLRSIPSEALIRTISKIGMTDAKGLRITHGYDFDLAHDVILGISGGTAEMIKISGTPDSIEIIANFKENGQFISPPMDRLAVYRHDGEKLCFEYKDVTKARPKMAFTLLLDRSGSMYGVIDDVRISAKQFLSALPVSAECAVASFNDTFHFHNTAYQNCNQGAFNLDALEADGGTNLYDPLLSAYQSLSQPYFKDYQKAAIIITDGRIVNDDVMIQKILASKNDILTFVYFLGEREDKILSNLADAFLKNTSDFKANLDQYFHSLQAAYGMQKVLLVHRCQGGGYAKQ